MKTYGVEQRSKPRLRVLRGWDPNNPTKLTSRAPVKSGVTVKSGQVISLAWVASEAQWELGCVAPRIPHFAVQDSDDFDVVGSGVLNGLSCLDSFEIQTAYFNAGGTFNLGAALTFDALTGDVKEQLVNDGTVAIIGYTTRFNGPTDVAAEETGVTPDGSGKVNVVTFATQYTPAND